jgi:hypothetical protein
MHRYRGPSAAIHAFPRSASGFPPQHLVDDLQFGAGLHRNLSRRDSIDIGFPDLITHDNSPVLSTFLAFDHVTMSGIVDSFSQPAKPINDIRLLVWPGDLPGMFGCDPIVVQRNPMQLATEVSFVALDDVFVASCSAHTCPFQNGLSGNAGLGDPPPPFGYRKTTPMHAPSGAGVKKKY